MNGCWDYKFNQNFIEKKILELEGNGFYGKYPSKFYLWSPGVQVSFLGDSYLLVMAYHGMVSIFVDVLPILRNGTILFSFF